MEDIDEKLEKKIEQKLSRLKDPEKIDRETLKQEIMQELREERHQEEGDILPGLGSDRVSRRSFLKMLGLGTGGLALASSASAAFGQVVASSQGKSDVDADTIDGFDIQKNGTDGNGIINFDTSGKITIDGDSVVSGRIEATGGDEVIETTLNGQQYKIHAFKTVGTSTFTINNAPSGAGIDVLVVGGGGGATGSDGSGGGGAGGLAYVEAVPVQEGQKSVKVGAGGQAVGSSDGSTGENGDDSVFDGAIIARGGGGGGEKTGGSIPSGGCTGGKGQNNSANDVPPTQPGTNADVQGTVVHDAGNRGEQDHGNSDFGGGGGGAGESGFNITQGGDGIDMSPQFGTSFGENGFFAGGGGGSENDGTRSNPASGGLGGGGDGGEGGNGDSGPPGEDGLPNTGGGAGGSAGDSSGASGGSGIVLIRYET